MVKIGFEDDPKRAIEEGADYEPELKAAFKTIIDETNPHVFVDLGGHIGLYTRLFASVVHQADIHVFEPEPTHHEYIEETAILWREWYGATITLYKMAISNFVGEKEMFICYGSCAALDREFVSRMKNPIGTFKVAVSTLDELFHGKRQVDMIKMDVEAEEVNVLLGARKLLTEQHPVVMIEAHKHQNDTVRGIMMGYGYEPYLVDDGRFSCWRES